MHDDRVRDGERVQLSTAQHLIWAAQELHPGEPVYNMAITFEIERSIDPDTLERAVSHLVAQVDALRTVITQVDGVPSQAAIDEVAFQLPVVDLSESGRPSEALREWATARCSEPMRLGERTFDVALARLGAQRSGLYLAQHHTLTDAWSFTLLFDRLSEIYSSLESGEEPAFEPLPSYLAHVAGMSTAEPSPDVSEPVVGSPLTYYGVDVTERDTASSRIRLDLGEELSNRIRARSREADVAALTADLSLFRLFATAVFAYLHRVTGENELTLGAPAHNRSTESLRKTVGLLTEVLPLSVDISRGETFASLFPKVVASVDAYLRSARPGSASAALNRSIDTVFNYITTSFGDFAGAQVRAEWIPSGHMEPEYLLRLHVADFGGGGDYSVLFDFNEAIVDAVGGDSIPRHFLRIIEAMLDAWDDPVDSIPLTSEQESAILSRFNDTGPAVTESTVIDLILDRAAETPGAIAMVEDGRTWTYQEIDSLTRRAAAGLPRGSIIGIGLPRSAEAVLAMLAVLRAGSAYVVVDPSWPEQRTEFVTQDAGCSLVIGAVAGWHGSVADLDTLLDAKVTAVGTAAIRPNDLAYVLYTSGSTGEPKGVMIEHRSLANYVSWASGFYDRGRRLSFPLFSTLAFDLTVTSMYVPLVSGGRIVVYPESEGEIDLAVQQVFEDGEVDVVKLTPSHLSLLPERLPTGRISQLILGGEDLTTAAARRISDRFEGDVSIHNEYGPTEATVGCIVHTFDSNHDVGRSVPIGRPIPGMRAYVLNDAGQPAPIGVPGELWLGGVGVARGYLNRQELSSERFRHIEGLDPSRLYATGDMARIRPDGVMEYLGRDDDQVKVRGVRVELGEVEAAMAAHPRVKTAAAKLMRSAAETDSDLSHCVRCGLPSNYPGVSFDTHGVCDQCRSYDRYADRARVYFKPMDELERILERGRANSSGDYDCISLLSGGKDSTYALARLVDTGARVLAFTLDNGYISEEAKGNIRRVCDTLGVDHVFGSTPAMDQIFVDSLQRHANVCNGCFKTIYTLSLQLAREKGVPLIVTGLSRGQFFETRLTEDLFTDRSVTAADIDAKVLEARKAYHRVDDAPKRLLDVSVIEDGEIFGQVQFVDFYRYCDVSLDEMLEYLDQRLPWVRPADTGRSTNCLINDVGIFFHKKERGYHNYALPYSWDVRLGHKQRDQALRELDDDIDIERVQAILEEIGFPEDVSAIGAESRLLGYYVPDGDVSPGELREHLSSLLPSSVIPSRLIPIESIPLTSNGKLDRDALPDPGAERPAIATPYIEASNETEASLASIWAEVLGLEEVGVRDGFFDLGGDSIMAIQIVARAKRAGVGITLANLFEAQTIERLAPLVIETSEGAAEPYSGQAALTPIQRWFFAHQPKPGQFNHILDVDSDLEVDVDLLTACLDTLGRHHPALRQAFSLDDEKRWVSVVSEEWVRPEIRVEKDLEESERRETASWLRSPFDLERPPLLRIAMRPREKGGTRLTFSAHHLITDAVTWDVLIDDLDHLYRSNVDGRTPSLPPPTDHVQRWVEALSQAAPGLDADRWLGVMGSTPPIEEGTTTPTQRERIELSPPLTEDLIRGTPQWRISVDELLLSALAATLAPLTDRATSRVFLEGHGRITRDPSLDVTRTLGWFTSLYPIEIPVSSGLDPIAVMSTVKDQMRSASERGAEFGVLQQLSPSERIRSALHFEPTQEIAFNYLGHLGTSAARGFSVAGPMELAAADEALPMFALQVDAWISERALTIELSKRVSSVPPLGELTGELMARLMDMIESCRSGAADLVTPADFPHAELDEGRLDQLASLLADSAGEEG